MRQCCAICGNVFETGTINSNVCSHCSIHKFTANHQADPTWLALKQAESELATWIHENTESLKLIQKLNAELNQIEAERDTLKARCEKLEDYVHHAPICLKVTLCHDEPIPCTCGLDELRKQGEEK